MSTNDPAALRVIPFAEDLLEAVADFHCGDESYEHELADWIRQEAPQAMAGGTDVWLFATAGGELVGYGSLGTTRWKWPDSASPKVPVQVIPAVAIQKAYWGKPEGPREARYSSQILDHLIAEASDRSAVSPLLGLFVHPDNQRAIRVYQRVGFTPYTHTYTDKTTGVVYRSMLYELRRRTTAQ